MFQIFSEMPGLECFNGLGGLGSLNGLGGKPGVIQWIQC